MTFKNIYHCSIDGNDQFLQHVSMQLHDRFGDDYAGAWQTLPNVRMIIISKFMRTSNKFKL